MSYSQLDTQIVTRNLHRYDAVHDTDGHSDANTEVGDWDVEINTKPIPLSRSQTRRFAFWKILRNYSWTMNTALLLIIAGLLIEERWNPRHLDRPFELAGDITGFAPRFAQQIVSFKPDSTFAPEDATQFWSNETQHAWLSIVPGMKVSIPNTTQLHKTA